MRLKIKGNKSEDMRQNVIQKFWSKKRLILSKFDILFQKVDKITFNLNLHEQNRAHQTHSRTDCIVIDFTKSFNYFFDENDLNWWTIKQKEATLFNNTLHGNSTTKFESFKIYFPHLSFV